MNLCIFSAIRVIVPPWNKSDSDKIACFKTTTNSPKILCFKTILSETTEPRPSYKIFRLQAGDPHTRLKQSDCWLILLQLTKTELEISSKRVWRVIFSLKIMQWVYGPSLEAAKHLNTSGTMDFKVTSMEIPPSIQGYYFPYHLTNESSHKQKSQWFSEEINQQTRRIQGTVTNSTASFCWGLPTRCLHSTITIPAISKQQSYHTFAAL